MSIVIRLLFFLFIIQLMGSCGITYTVRNTKNELEELLYMPCGKVGFELEGRGNSKFLIRQKYTLKEKVLINPDSIKVLLNGKHMDLEYLKKSVVKNEGVYEIESGDELEIRFELEKGVFDGDTIVIFAPRYIKCNRDYISLDSVYYTFTNRLRIQGVNAL